MLDTDLDIARKVLDVNVVAAFSWIKKAVAAGLGDEEHPAPSSTSPRSPARAPAASSAGTACPRRRSST